MTQENEPIVPENEREAYNQLSQYAPPRDAEVADPSVPPKQGLAEALEFSEDLTDFQAAIKLLRPMERKYTNVMSGRIDPGVFLSALHLMSVDEIMRHDPQKEIDVNLIYMTNYVWLSIGLEGRGIIDVAELLGAERDEKKAKNLLLGAGGRI